MQRILGRARWIAGCLAAAFAIAGCGGSHQGGPHRQSACASQVKVAVLPNWARTGFSDPRPRMPYELGSSGEIAAIVWGFPLLAPPVRDHNNKILWVSRVATGPASDLHIAAQRMQGTTPVGSPVSRNVAGGPGPSTIDVPTAGCWRLTLHWSGRVDSLDLNYAAARS